jgi:hypothetical protein
MSDSFIFNPLNDTEKLALEKNEFYSSMGSQDYLDDQNYPRISKENDKRILAKKITREDGSIKYSVKLTNNGKMQNPLSMYGVEKDTTFLDRVCRSNDKFKEVNYKVFNLYINFLKTKNIAWLHNAEREAE